MSKVKKNGFWGSVGDQILKFQSFKVPKLQNSKVSKLQNSEFSKYQHVKHVGTRNSNISTVLDPRIYKNNISLRCFWISGILEVCLQLVRGSRSNIRSTFGNVQTCQNNIWLVPRELDLTSSPWSRVMRSPFWKTLFKRFPLRMTQQMPTCFSYIFL